MDIFEGPYYNLNRKLLRVLGLWPFDTKTRYVVRATFTIVMFLLIMPHLISAMVNSGDVDRLMLNLLAFLTAMVMVLKMVALTIAENKTRKLFENMANNWLAIRDDEERAILLQYSERSRIITIFYTVAMGSCGIMISVIPLAPKILDKMYPLDKPRPNIYLLEGEFFVDREEYYVELFFCDLIITLMVSITTIAVDTMYITSTEHCCALNSIIRYYISLPTFTIKSSTNPIYYIHINYRLRNLGKKTSENLSVSDDDSCNVVIHIIKLHQIAISFTSMINDAFSLNVLFIMTVNIVVIPLDVCAIIANLNDLIGLCPYATFFIALMIHFFVFFWPGQRVLDHNLSLTDDACNNEWYELPLRTKKLLLIYALRCSEPASLSAGGLFLINFETYSMVMRTSMSYITVLASFR